MFHLVVFCLRVCVSAGKIYKGKQCVYFFFFFVMIVVIVRGIDVPFALNTHAIFWIQSKNFETCALILTMKLQVSDSPRGTISTFARYILTREKETIYLICRYKVTLIKQQMLPKVMSIRLHGIQQNHRNCDINEKWRGAKHSKERAKIQLFIHSLFISGSELNSSFFFKCKCERNRECRLWIIKYWLDHCVRNRHHRHKRNPFCILDMHFALHTLGIACFGYILHGFLFPSFVI